ncbi:MAG: hypothetical protein A3F17_08750 [Gammaproteobacteria bacterium RIFCSPHIGHO2_12_FULL_41_15]|nr:MAG: hypothetical protein A3F17_08750 [Gammaproteobacteria bacterium RIFCSPHIGHO2_12_FULL_41_15]
MKRAIIDTLKNWQVSPIRMPLLLRGARQIGKTHCVRQFGQTHFEHFCEINFEFSPKSKLYFNSLNPKEIIQTLSINQSVPLIPGKTLLLLDEIQECPNAILALRYFKEMMPEFHVIGAGSLLEFALKKADFRMPVGRIEYRYMYPMSFYEFLLEVATNTQLDYLNNITLDETIAEATHQTFSDYFKQYLIVGGMPESVKTFYNNKNYQLCSDIQAGLLNTYRNDFGKYSSAKEIPLVEEIFYEIPNLVGQIFKYSHINPNYRARDLKPALNHLIDANIIFPIYHSNTAGIPLYATRNIHKFKSNFVDIGLLVNHCNLSSAILMQKDFFAINRGAIMEQFVGQELLAYSNNIKPGELFFWDREKSQSTAEVDFIIQVDDKIVPIEVKAGITGRLKSLKMLMEMRQLNLGVRISLNTLSLEKNILSVPAYLIYKLEDLVREAYSHLAG